MGVPNPTLFIGNVVHHVGWLRRVLQRSVLALDDVPLEVRRRLRLQKGNHLVVELGVRLGRLVQLLVLCDVVFDALLPLVPLPNTYRELLAPNRLVDRRTVVADVCSDPRQTAVPRLLAERTVHDGVLRTVLVDRCHHGSRRRRGRRRHGR